MVNPYIQIIAIVALFASMVWTYNKKIDGWWIFGLAFLMVSCQAAGIK